MTAMEAKQSAATTSVTIHAAFTDLRRPAMEGWETVFPVGTPFGLLLIGWTCIVDSPLGLVSVRIEVKCVDRTNREKPLVPEPCTVCWHTSQHAMLRWVIGEGGTQHVSIWMPAPYDLLSG